MTPPPPDAAARHAEVLHALARGPRDAGIALAALGVGAALLRGTVAPWLPGLVPVALIVTALGLMLIGIVRRARIRLHRPKGIS